MRSVPSPFTSLPWRPVLRDQVRDPAARPTAILTARRKTSSWSAPAVVAGGGHGAKSVLGPGAAVTKYHKWGGLEKQEFNVLQLWRLKVRNPCVSRVGGPVLCSLLASDGWFAGPPWLLDASLGSPSLTSHGVLCVRLFTSSSFHARVSLCLTFPFPRGHQSYRVGAHPNSMASREEPVSKQGRILSSGDNDGSVYFLGGHNSTHNKVLLRKES